MADVTSSRHLGAVAPNMVLYRVSVSRSHGHGSAEFTVRIEDLDLVIRRGETTGLLGSRRDGVGVVADLLAGKVQQSGGEVYTSCRPVLLSWNNGFLAMETLRFNLTRFGMAHRFNGASLKKAVGVVAQESQVTDVLDLPVNTLDADVVAKARLFMALATGTRVIIIDDPGDFVSVMEDVDVASKLRAFKVGGGSIVVVSHDGKILEKLCERVLWFAAGEFRLEASPPDALRVHSKVLRLERSNDVEGLERAFSEINELYRPPKLQLRKS